MKSKWRVVFALIFTTILSQNVFALKPNDTVPNLFGRTLEGELFRLTSVPGPKVINFFWVECKPCVKEMPELAELAKSFPKIKFISVHVSENDEDSKIVAEFVKNLKAAPETIVLSPPMVKENFDFFALPHTLVVDGNDQIKAIVRGYNQKGMTKLKSALKSL